MDEPKRISVLVDKHIHLRSSIFLGPNVEELKSFLNTI
jgi:hypothetical protein